jgi:hypothetical protein
MGPGAGFFFKYYSFAEDAEGELIKKALKFQGIK